MAAIKNVVIFGASGFTGLHAVKSAIKEGNNRLINSNKFIDERVGLKVRAFVRDVEKLPEEVRSKVEPFKGDVLNIEDVRKAVHGQDGVVVVLGTRNDLGKSNIDKKFFERDLN